MTMSERSDDIGAVLRAQRAHRWTMARTTAVERIERLTRLRDHVWERREDIHGALWDDFHKSSAEADITEIYPTLAEINHTIRHLESWMRPKPVKAPKMLLGTSSEVRYEAKGVVLVLSPWNYPINLLLNPLIAAISAGNCAVIKPSSKVPRTASLVKELISELFPPEEVAVFLGSSAVANELLTHKFDHIFFTGSTRVGRLVMAAAAKHLTPVTLELGGKSPAIVDESADIELAAERILWGKLINAGQTCIAPDFVLVQEGARDRFVARAREVIEERFGLSEEARRQSPSLCLLNNERHARWLREQLRATLDQGDELLFGGESDPEARYFEPTLVGTRDEKTPIMEEELFGPVLPILTFGTLEQAIGIVRNRPKPLALYVFSRDDASIERVLCETTSGGSCVNNVIVHLANPDLPFGGVGDSGMGRYHGFRGFQELSNERSVLRQKRPDTVRYFYPPYTSRVKKLIELATRFMS